MTEPERRGLEHVVLPRRRPGLALLERHRPPPADNLLDAELAAFAAAGDTILDPWAGTGSVARPGRARRRLHPAGGLATGRCAAQAAHRGALRLSLRDMPASDRGGPVHLA